MMRTTWDLVVALRVAEHNVNVTERRWMAARGMHDAIVRYRAIASATGATDALGELAAAAVLAETRVAVDYAAYKAAMDRRDAARAALFEAPTDERKALAE